MNSKLSSQKVLKPDYEVRFYCWPSINFIGLYYEAHAYQKK